MTGLQRRYARQRRAVLQLCRAAACFSLINTHCEDYPYALNDLQRACDNYANTLTIRELSKLTKGRVRR